MNDKLLKIYALADAISQGSIAYKTDAKEIKKLLEEYANECGGEKGLNDGYVFIDIFRNSGLRPLEDRYQGFDKGV